LQNFSSNSHTTEFLAEKLKEVINNVGEKKISAVVSD